MTDLSPESDPPAPAQDLQQIADALAEAMGQDERMTHASSEHLPDRDILLDLLEVMREVLFPGFFGPREIPSSDLSSHLAARLAQLEPEWAVQIAGGLAYGVSHGRTNVPGVDESPAIARAFMEQLPQLRRLLSLDVQAAFDGDPAARHTDEALLCYPGITALYVHRIAHALYELRVPLVPRILQEFAHAETGIDIHPGAKIGESFFVDHGTGVVIGETTVIGRGCKVYQGVTLGARSFEKDERGGLKRGTKRHPTLGDNVTVYAGATVLGGDTHIGDGAVIAGGVFLTRSVPADHVAQGASVEIRVRPHHGLA
ncbi:MAG: serine O-acetyltransferase [Phycisphaerales bacterium]|nr:serine O-acetyltransferase [Phycisphaerales bacterium]